MSASPALPDPPNLLMRLNGVERFERGAGIVTLPFAGKWNSETCTITTGMTVFPVGTGLPLHTHNVEENVLILEGAARAVLGEQEFDLEPGDATWVPAGTPHRFLNRGDALMRIYWVYGGRDVTRTICATGETFEHLSSSDRGGAATGR
jgi:HTH-type transcriptional repressor of puuD